MDIHSSDIGIPCELESKNILLKKTIIKKQFLKI